VLAWVLSDGESLGWEMGGMAHLIFARPLDLNIEELLFGYFFEERSMDPSEFFGLGGGDFDGNFGAIGEFIGKFVHRGVKF
jgi:hypothetical protein